MDNQEFINEDVIQDGFRAKTLGKLTHTKEETVTRNPIVLSEVNGEDGKPLIAFQVIETRIETMSGGLISQVRACSEEVEEIVLGLPMTNLIHARLVGPIIKVDPSE